MLINDRIDIALATGADGVHLGQTDMPPSVARSLLPPHTVIGVSCNNVAHVQKAVEDGADYVGLGSIYGTNTKDVSAPGRVCGVKGARAMLAALEGTAVKAVAIGTRCSLHFWIEFIFSCLGGIKSTNLLRTLHGASAPSGCTLDGVAVVSDIVASSEPRAAAQRLQRIFRSWSNVPHVPESFTSNSKNNHTAEGIVEAAAALLDNVRKLKPLVHQVTSDSRTQAAILSFLYPICSF